MTGALASLAALPGEAVLAAAFAAGGIVSWLLFALPARRRARAAQAALATAEENERRVDRMLEDKFRALAADALQDNGTRFLELVSERFERHRESAGADLEARRKAIETLVKPLDENLGAFRDYLGEIEKTREGAYRSVADQMRALRTETGRLASALKQPAAGGRWGEYQLRNVFELAGMSEHVDFVEQPTMAGEEGALRPDAIVRLPGGKRLVVDAKTPLQAYLAAAEAEDDEARARHVADHARQVRHHVRALASKAYWSALDETPDFVVMFLPGEAFYAAALESDPTLFDSAVRERVLICTPTTFVALVKAVAHGWQQQTLAENARAVAALARDLYGRIGAFGGHMHDLGRALGRAVDRYNKGVGALESRVLPAARKFETLGVAPPADSLPEVAPVEREARELRAPELTAPEAAAPEVTAEDECRAD